MLELSLEIYIPFKVFRHKSESDWVLLVFRCSSLSMGQCLERRVAGSMALNKALHLLYL